MMRRSLMSLALAAAAALVVTPVAMAETSLSGEMDLKWNTCYGAPPSEEIPDWIGTVELDGNLYDMLFFNVGTGRPPTDRVEEPELSVHELWAIYDGLELTFDDECAVETFEGDVVMWGHDYGVANFAETLDYHMAGTVLEAFGDFADLAGHPMQVNGTVVMGEAGPEGAPGTFTVN